MTTAIDHLLKEFDGAFAPNTIRSYRSDLVHFSTWCTEHGVAMERVTADELATYIADMTPDLASATISRRIASISSVFKINGLEDTTNGPAVVLAMKRMHRKKGRAQAQAIPLTRDVLDKLLSACGNDLPGQRDRVMLLLGYETMRRRSELCHLTFEDIELLPKGKTAIRLRFSKTDQFGQGKLLPVSADLLDSINQWGERCNHSGRILRGLHRGNSLRDSMAPATINLRLKALQKKAGLALEGELSGHSFRVGAAVDLLAAGETLEKIMLRGGWTAESTAIRYLRAWQAV